MYDVRIAENNIIAAGSVVTKSTEPNSVYAGVPARKIGTFADSAAKRKAMEDMGLVSTVEPNQGGLPQRKPSRMGSIREEKQRVGDER